MLSAFGAICVAYNKQNMESDGLWATEHRTPRYAPSSPRKAINETTPLGSRPSERSIGPASLPSAKSSAVAPTFASPRGFHRNDRQAASQRTFNAAPENLQKTHAPVAARSASSPSAAHVREPSAHRPKTVASSRHKNQSAEHTHREEGRATVAPTPRHSREPSASHPQAAPAHPTHGQKRAGKSSNIFCGNNALSPKLRENGGTQIVGSPSRCFRKGFGAGYHQEILPERLEEFLQDFSGPYKRLIEQPIYYGDGPVPQGMFRATLSQCRARGFGVGSLQRAKRILKERKRSLNKT